MQQFNKYIQNNTHIHFTFWHLTINFHTETGDYPVLWIILVIMPTMININLIRC